MSPKEESVSGRGLTLSVIGCGTMATAILSGVLAACEKDSSSGESPVFTRFMATVNSEASIGRLDKKFGSRVNISRDNIKAMREGDVVLFAFKPYQVAPILSANGVQEALTRKSKSIISVLVGSPVNTLKDTIESCGPVRELYITRAMPNLAAEFGQSMTVIESHLPDEANQAFDTHTDFIFSSLGRTQFVAPAQFDIGGVLAGASGALFSVAFDGMLDAAVSNGLKRAEAKKILTGALRSMVALLDDEDGKGGKKEGMHPAVMREGVSSPSGTTIAGLLVLEEEKARWGFCKAVDASTKRSKEMGAS